MSALVVGHIAAGPEFKVYATGRPTRGSGRRAGVVEGGKVGKVDGKRAGGNGWKEK